MPNILIKQLVPLNSEIAYYESQIDDLMGILTAARAQRLRLIQKIDNYRFAKTFAPALSTNLLAAGDLDIQEVTHDVD